MFDVVRLTPTLAVTDKASVDCMSEEDELVADAEASAKLNVTVLKSSPRMRCPWIRLEVNG